MGHKIIEAVIENGKIKYVDKKLPDGRLTVHLIYDAVDEVPPENEIANIVRKSSGIYKNVDVESEAEKLRMIKELEVVNPFV